MKKAITIVSILLLCMSCTNETKTSLSADLIIGTWSKSDSMDDPTLNQSLQYIFNLDNTLEVSRIITNNSTSEIVGFRYKAIGMYEINDDILNMYFSEIYTYDDSSGLYSNTDDLTLSGYTSTEEVTVSFNKDGKMITFFYPPCPPNAICIGSQTFEKSKK